MLPNVDYEEKLDELQEEEPEDSDTSDAWDEESESLEITMPSWGIGMGNE